MKEQSDHSHKSFLRRYSLVIAALLLAAVMVGGSLWYVRHKEAAEEAARKSFDPSTVLPSPVAPSESQTAFTAATLKAHDGQNGNKCYVAVKGIVYEIKDSAYWQNGKHTPSNGQGFCGADMTEVIKQAPHGETMLERLSKVGTYE